MNYQNYKCFKFAPKQVQKYIVHAQMELLDDKLGKEIVINNNLEIICAFNEEVPVGVIMYDSYSVDTKWIYLIYIEPEYRRKGICTTFFNYLKPFNLEFGTHPTNMVMIMTGKNNGFKEKMLILSYSKE